MVVGVHLKFSDFKHNLVKSFKVLYLYLIMAVMFADIKLCMCVIEKCASGFTIEGA